MKRMAGLFLGILAMASSDAAALAKPLAEKSASTIGYSSVAKALAGVSSRPGIHRFIQDGWIILEDKAAHTVWSFAPEGSPPFPAAVRRRAVSGNGGTHIEMDVLCQATKEACDDMVAGFKKLNETMGRKLSQPR
jgi:hypothetical protein